MHHREIHEELLRGGVSLQFEPDTRKRIAQALRASAVYDRKRADATERWADLLEEWKGEQVMKGNAKQSGSAARSEPAWMDRLIISTFKMASPVWERYDGKVPARGLRRLELAGDWPRGLAAVIVKRLTRDEELRRCIHKLVIEGRASRGT